MKAHRHFLYRMTVMAALFFAVGAGSYEHDPSKRIPNTEAVAACRFLSEFKPATAVLGVSPVANVVVAGASFDFDGDGQVERLDVRDQGTAHFEEAVVIRDGEGAEDLAGPGLEDIDEIDEDVRWAHGVRWLIHTGKAYIVRFAGNGLGYPVYLGLPHVDDYEQPICRFQPVVEKWLVGEDPAGQLVCDALVDGKVEFIAPESGKGDEKSLFWRVDFMNDGRARKVSIAMLDSSAGAGCSQRIFQPADNQTDLSARLLREAQGELGHPNCADDDPRWFRFDGKTYLESRSQSPDAPRQEAQEKHTVHLIEGGSARLICRAQYSYGSPKLIGIWNGSGWRIP